MDAVDVERETRRWDNSTLADYLESLNWESVAISEAARRLRRLDAAEQVVETIRLNEPYEHSDESYHCPICCALREYDKVK